MDGLSILEDPQVGLLMLRACMGISKLTSIPLGLAQPEVSFNQLEFQSVITMLTSFNDQSW